MADSAQVRGVQGRTAMITGAGQGIGRATALAFAAAGASVAVADWDLKLADSTVSEIQASGGTAVAIVMDVTVPEQVEHGIEDATGRLGPITILVNNAGGGNPPTTILSSDAEWNRIVDLNLKGIIHTCRALWPRLVDGGGGVILNASSLAASRPMAGLIAYCTSKAAVVQLTKCLALAGAPHGIRANCVAPGFVRTPALEEYFASTGDPEETAGAVAATVPVGRLGGPQEIAAVYVHLASDAASYITGAEVPVDGGSSIA